MLKKLSTIGVGVKSLLFENTTTRQTIAKNTFWLTISNVVGRVLRAAVVIYAARILGAEQWGIFSYITSLAALFTIFTDLGINMTLVKESTQAKDEQQYRAVLSTSFYIKLGLSVIGSVLIFLLVPIVTKYPAAIPLIPAIALIMFFDNMREFGSAVVKSLERMELEAGVFILTNLSIVIAGFLFLSLSPSVSYFTYAYVIGTGLGMGFALWSIRGNMRSALSNFSRRLVRPIMQTAWPLAIANLLGSIMINTDILIISFFLSAENVGFYSAAQRPVQLLYLIPPILASAAFPALSRAARESPERFSALVQKMLVIIYLAALPIVVGGVLTGREIVELLFGADYLPATFSFQVLLATLLVNFPAPVLSVTLFARDQHRVLIRATTLAGIANIVLDLLLIPPLGIDGSAIATLISQTIFIINLRREVGKIHQFFVVRHLKVAAVATAGMAAATIAFLGTGAPVLVTVGVSACVYFALLALLKEPLLRDVRSILHVAG